MQLVMVACHPFDIQAGKRASRLLEEMRPTVVAIERSQKNFDYMRDCHALYSNDDHKRRMKVRAMDVDFPDLNFKTTHELLKSQGSLETSLLDFATNVESRIVYCSWLDGHTFHEINGMMDVTKPSSASFHFSSMELEDMVEKVEEIYCARSYSVRGKEREIGNEDIRIARMLRATLPDVGTCIYFGSLMRLFGEYKPNLYDMLDDFLPARIKLSEVPYLSSFHPAPGRAQNL